MTRPRVEAVACFEPSKRLVSGVEKGSAAQGCSG
jgi:hypothetical protein